MDIRAFFKKFVEENFFFSKITNTKDISDPIVAEIKKLPKDFPKQEIPDFSGPIVDAIESLDIPSGKKPVKVSLTGISAIALKGDKGDPGAAGEKPSKDEIIELIKPLIPAPIKGKDGKDYILTARDKKEIAKSIDVPVVEKVIETIVEKQPIVTNEVREVAVADPPEVLKEKLESLKGNERLDAKAIKNLPQSFSGGGMNSIQYANDVALSNPSTGQVLVFNNVTGKWENGAVTGGDGSPGGSDTQVQFNDGGSFGGDPGLTYNKTADKLSTAALNLSGLTASEVVITDSSKNLVSATVATYPSLTEFSYIKGVTSAVQGQLDGKLDDAQLDDTAYGAGWNGDTTHAPTKNAVYDKIETITAGSGITRTVVITSGSATMGSSSSTDYVYFVAGAHTMSLPAAAGNTNRYTVKNNHSANVTIDTAGAENVEGAASISIAPEESVDIVSNGTNWFII